MPSPISPITGTGLAGSLTYSSKPSVVLVEREKESFPPASRWSERAVAFFGGQESKRRHSFLPVSNIQALGIRSSGADLRLFSRRACRKNGNSIFSRKNSPVFEEKLRLPNRSPSRRVHSPWDHGPMTSVNAKALPSFSIARHNFRVPPRSSASNQPPTNSTGAVRRRM